MSSETISNYPPGTWAGDPRAPWNQEDPADAPVTRCADCAEYHAVPDVGCKCEWPMGFCTACGEYVEGDESPESYGCRAPRVVIDVV